MAKFLQASALFLAASALFACDPQDHTKVPEDAKPDGFTRLVSWNSCGASGEICSEIMVFGSNDISFEAAAEAIVARYNDKGGWTIRSLRIGSGYEEGVRISNREMCMSITRFDVENYRRDLLSPEPTTLAGIVSPYSTLLKVSASGCG